MFKSHIKLIVLKQLSTKKSSGYDLMKSIESFGKKPSPGYIYPLLGDLQKKGFISVKQKGRKKIYSITSKGKKLLENLKANHRKMLMNTAKIIRPIADKKELDILLNLRLGIKKEGLLSKDRQLFEKLKETMLSVYGKSDREKINKMKKILEETIKKLNKIG